MPDNTQTNEPNQDDVRWMQRAIELAARADSQTRPNPMVGCVIVKDGEVIGEAFHEKAGQLHAERLALKACNGSTAGATAYVTLEPCNHIGKTPPCSVALIEAGIKRVVIGQSDPNLEASGGMDRLEWAGIEVVKGVLEAEARNLNPAFTKFHQTGQPFMTMKWAMSLDGCTSAPNGDSKWITGPEARRQVHHQRAQHDAIMIGIETALKDQAKLTVRDWTLNASPPIRIIVDSKLRLPTDHPLLNKENGILEAPVWIFCHKESFEESSEIRVRGEQLQKSGVSLFPVTGENSQPSPSSIMKTLGEKKVMSVYLEGGRTLTGSFIKARFLDQVIAFIAPKIIGASSSSTSPITGLSNELGMDHNIDLEDVKVEVLDQDGIMVIGLVHQQL